MLTWTAHWHHTLNLPRYKLQCFLYTNYSSLITEKSLLSRESSKGHLKSLYLAYVLSILSIPSTISFPFASFPSMLYLCIISPLYYFNSLLSLLMACSILPIQSTVLTTGWEISLSHPREQVLPYLKTFPLPLNDIHST